VFYGTLVAVFLTVLVVPVVYAWLARRTGSPGVLSRKIDAMMAGGRGGDAPAPALPATHSAAD
jgi:1,6-anhydro-N-acetylmuramate kinase